jgi:hypothetical protein
MLRARVLIGAITSILVIGGVAAGSASAASEFIAGTTGASLVAKALETQVLTTKAGEVKCPALKASAGKTSGPKASTLTITIHYEECTVIGFPATVSSAEYELNAEIGPVTPKNVKILKAITISSSACTITVPAQTVGEVHYKNGTGIEVLPNPNITGITSSGKGLVCSYASESNGTLVGKSLISAAGGLEWV